MSSSAFKTGKAVSQARPKKSLVREYAEALAIAFVLALVIRFFLFQAFSIPSGSMEKTLLIGDYLLVNKLSYGIRNPLDNKVLIPLGKPQRGDVVVFIFPQDPSKDYIKRVIGLPGDTVQITNKKVLVNGKVFETPRPIYEDTLIIPAPRSPIESARDNFGPVVVPANSISSWATIGTAAMTAASGASCPWITSGARPWSSIFLGPGPSRRLLPGLDGGTEGLVHNFAWNSQQFRMRWDRMGRVIH